MSQSSPRAGAPRAALLALAVAAGACADPTAVDPVELPLAAADAAPAFLKEPAAAQPTPQQYVVLFKSGARGPSAGALAASGAVRRGTLAYAGGAVYDKVANPAALAADPAVEAVVENATFSGDAFSYQRSALFERRGWQWSMHQIRADSVPAAVVGGGVRVCIVDSGIDDTHQDLAGKVVAKASFVTVGNGFPVTSPNPSLDSASHGSHVAGTVTSNGVGVASVAPGVRLLNARVFAASNTGTFAAILEGMAWCRANNADVVNMSLSGQFPKPLTPGLVALVNLMDTEIAALRANGAVVVVSAGNQNARIDPAANWMIIPAQTPGAVTVASTAPGFPFFNFPFPTAAPAAGFDGKARYSNLGEDVDIYAPGGTGFGDRVQSQVISVCSSARPGCAGGKLYMGISGTSMAAPHATGVAALITGRSGLPRGLARVEAVEACLGATGDVITVAGTVANNPFAAGEGTGLQSITRPRINARRAALGACAGI